MRENVVNLGARSARWWAKCLPTAIQRVDWRRASFSLGGLGLEKDDEDEC